MPRRLAAAAIFLLVLLLERFAYYGARSILYLYLREQDPVNGAHLMAIFSWAITLTPVLGAALCAVLPARFVVVLGTIGALAGFALLAFLHGIGIWIALGVVALSLGLFRPAILIAAGDLFRRRDNERITLFALLYAAINLGALGAPNAFGAVRQQFGASPAFLLSAGVMLTVTLFAAVAAVLPMLLRDDEPPPAPEEFRAEPILASLALIAAAVPGFVVQELLAHWQFAGDVPGWVDYINPCVILAIAPLQAGLFLALLFTRRSLPIAFVIAPGLVLAALSAIPALVLPASAPLIAMTLAIGAAGEALIAPLMLARLSAGVHPRAQGAVMALWLILSFASGSIARLVPDGITSTIVLAAMIGLSLVAAIVLLLLHRELRDAFDSSR